MKIGVVGLGVVGSAIKTGFEKLGHDIVCHDEIWLWPDSTNKVVNYGPEIRSSYINLLFKGNVISTSAISCRKDLLIEFNGFDENPLMVGNEDYELWMILKGKDAPVSLGLLPKSGTLELPKHIEFDATEISLLAISLEPLGGSPNGSPTEVLFTTELIIL